MKKIIGVLLALFALPVSAATQCGLIDLKIDAQFSRGTDNNDSGVIVGYLSTTENDPTKAFIWTAGKVTILDGLGGSNQAAYGINNLGDVVGLSETASGDFRAVMWIKGVPKVLGSKELSTPVAFAVNDKRQVVGVGGSRSGQPHAFIWQKGKLLDINKALNSIYSRAYGINNHGQVVGIRSGLDGRERPFLYENGTYLDLGVGGVAYGINDAGQVVGTTGSQAFIWQDGVMTLLGTLGGQNSEARAINKDGVVTGNSSVDGFISHPFIWKNGVMTDLGSFGGKDSGGLAINARGQVVGGSYPVDIGIRRINAFRWKRQC